MLFMIEIYSEWVRQLVHHCDAEVFCQGVEKKMTFSTVDESVSTFLLLANCFIRPWNADARPTWFLWQGSAADRQTAGAVLGAETKQAGVGWALRRSTATVHGHNTTHGTYIKMIWKIKNET